MDLGRKHAFVAAQMMAIEEQVRDIVHSVEDQVRAGVAGHVQIEVTDQPPAVIIDPCTGTGCRVPVQVRKLPRGHQIGSHVPRNLSR